LKNKPADTLYCGVNKKRIKKAQPVLNARNLLYLYNFIKRRYVIHLRKDVLKKDPPWTTDQVLRDFRFTNIRREHDKESKWVIEHITSNPELSYEDKLLNVILFRLYNKHETAELISMPFKFSETPDWNPEWYRSLFEAALVEDPKRVFFTAAFHTVGMKNTLKKVTGESYAPMRILKFIKILINEGLVDDIKACTNQQEVYQTLTDYNGIGRFLAYQFYVDMTYIAEFPFSENEFTVAGPGCVMGLNYLFEDRDGMSYEECLFWLRDNLDRLFVEELGKDWDAKRVFWDLPEEDRCFNVMSLENCFCELSKYIRAKDGTGRPRKRYKA
jgi:hypothetical protein